MRDKKKNYPSTKQFRHAVKYMREKGLDNILFQGTVKLHGTNTSIKINRDCAQIFSRNNEITNDDDSALYGFTGFIKDRQDVLLDIFPPNVVLHGEYIGEEIQGKVAVSELDKSFVVFDCSVNKEFVGLDYLKQQIGMLELKELNENNIYFIDQAPTYDLRLFLDNLEATQEVITEITLAVENECPFAKLFGVKGIGEGVVWKPINDKNNTNLWFKTKGEKHRKTEKERLPDDDIDVYNNFIEEHLLPEWRLEQGVSEMRMEGKAVVIENIGTYLKWINMDINKEESDLIEESKLDRKTLFRLVTKKAKEFYIKTLEQI